MLTAILISLGVVFVAELGDKSQLITMTYALRHRWWVVLTGVGIGAFLVHGLSVAVGHFLGLTLPEKPIAIAAAVAFLIFAVWTWRDSRDTDDDTVPAVAVTRHVLAAVVSSFVLAELGDKTMLATVALASEHAWAGVWIGATAGMVLADGAAIAVGAVLHRRLPLRFLHRLSSLLFLVVGMWLLFDSALELRGVAVAAVSGVIALAGIAAAVVRFRGRAAGEPAPPAPRG